MRKPIRTSLLLLCILLSAIVGCTKGGSIWTWPPQPGQKEEEPAVETPEPPAKEYPITTGEVWVKRGQMNIYGKLLLPVGAEGRLPAVICCHGLMRHHTDCLPYAEAFAKRGYAAYCFDFCGGSLAPRSSGISYKEMTVFTEQADLQAVLSLLRTLEQIDTTRLFLLGASQGGLVSAIEASEQKEALKGLILLYPAFNIPDLIRKRLAEDYPDPATIPDPVTEMGMRFYRPYWECLIDYDPYAVIGRYEGPVLIQHGNLDPLVPLSYSKKAKNTYRHAVLEILSGQGHGFFDSGFDLSVRQILKFLDAHGGTEAAE